MTEPELKTFWIVADGDVILGFDLLDRETANGWLARWANDLLAEGMSVPHNIQLIESKP